MTGQIPQDFIDNVLQHTNIVEIVSDYVTLRQRGKDFKGLCPFHSEKTPSFSVNTERQIFYCFGCHAGGNALTFLMKKENYPFLEALEILAERAGMSLPQKELSRSEREREAQRQRWRDIHSRASEYFQEELQRPEGQEALVYLHTRKIDDTGLSRFGLGYAPPGWAGLLTVMQKHGFTAQELEETGLVVAKKNDSLSGGTTHYDRFRNRVIFTIRDVQGRVIGFGGRVLDNAVPKYLNSPETMFFSKGRCLYALDLAVPAIRAKGYALLMEGYMDVISAHRVGFTTAVATLGTALTREQAHMLKRYTSKVFICYDGDEAGIQAASRAGEILMAEDIDSFVVNVSPAKDPDEFLVTAPQEFEARLQAAAPYLEFKFKTMLSGQSTQSAQDKLRLIQKITPEILQIKSPIVRESIERFIAQELDVTYEAVRHELFQIESKRKRTKKNRFPQEDFLPIQDISVRNRNTIEETPHAIGIPGTLQRSTFVPPGIFAAEQLILRILLEEPRLKEEVTQKLGVDFWSLGEHEKIFQSITGTAPVTAAPHTLQASLAAEIGYEDICGRLAAVMELEYIKGRENEMLNDCLISILDVQNKGAIEKMQNEAIRLYNNGDIEGSNDILQQIGERLRRG